MKKNEKTSIEKKNKNTLIKNFICKNSKKQFFLYKT